MSKEGPKLTRSGERRYMGIATYQEGDFQAVLDAIASGDFSLKGGSNSVTVITVY